MPTIETAVKVSETQYNKFTVILQPEVFNDSNGPVTYYGVIVCTNTTGMSYRCFHTVWCQHFIQCHECKTSSSLHIKCFSWFKSDVKVSFTSTGCKTTSESNQWLSNTYDQWKENQCSTYLAVIKDTRHRNVDEHVVIGDQTSWKGYKNGELYAKGSYR